MLTQTNATCPAWRLHLPWPQSPKFQTFPGKCGPTPGVKLDIPENLQVGAHSGCGVHNKNNIGPCQSVPAAAATFYGDGGVKYSQECWGTSPPQQRNAFRGAASEH